MEGFAHSVDYRPLPNDLLKLVCQYDFTLEDMKELQAFCIEKLCEQREHSPAILDPETCNCGLRYFGGHLSW